MAVATLERGIIGNGRTSGNNKAARPVMASEARKELEDNVLCAMLTGILPDPHLLGDVLDMCPPSCFATPDAAPLAEALDLLRKSGQRPTLTTLVVQMRDRWAKDARRWPAPDMARLAEMSTSAWGLKGHAESLARKLADEHRRAELHAGLLEIAAEASVYGVDSEYIADRARKLVEASGSVQEAVSMGDLMGRIRARLDNPRALRRIPTPWKPLNTILRGGFMPGELVVLAARPGLGKTAFAANVALDAARGGVGVLFVSCEMSDESLACRLISRVGRIDGRFFREGMGVTPQIRGAIDVAMGQLEALPLSIVEKSTVPMCPREVRRLARGIKDLGLIVVDYLQLLHPDEKNSSREREIAEMSRAFKQMAMDLQVPVLLLSQLNRASEEGKREPRVSDLRESGAIEQDADIILLLHTRDLDRANARPDVKCIVGKSRSTGTGAAFLRFEKTFSEFTEGEPWIGRQQIMRDNDL